MTYKFVAAVMKTVLFLFASLLLIAKNQVLCCVMCIHTQMGEEHSFYIQHKIGGAGSRSESSPQVDTF